MGGAYEKKDGDDSGQQQKTQYPNHSGYVPPQSDQSKADQEIRDYGHTGSEELE